MRQRSRLHEPVPGRNKSLVSTQLRFFFAVCRLPFQAKEGCPGIACASGRASHSSSMHLLSNTRGVEG